MRYPSLLILILVLLLVGPELLADRQSVMKKMDLTSQLCFVQPEVSGRMNVEESRVSVNNYQELTLMGGQAGCLYVPSGNYSFRIEFLDSERMFHRKSQSPEYKVGLEAGERAVFEIYPATRNDEYSGGWRARLVEHDRKE